MLPPEGIVLEQELAGGDEEERCRKADDGSRRHMALRSFGDGRVWMDTCRMVALSGAVVASTAGLARSMRQYLLYRWIGERRRRQALRVCRTGVCPRPNNAAWLGPPTLDVRLWCDVCLVFGSDNRHPFIEWIGVATDVAKMVALDYLMYYLVRSL